MGEWLNLMRDIDDQSAGAAAQDDALHGANIVIFLTEIGGERDDGSSHTLLKL